MVRHIIPKTLQEALTYLSEGTFKIMAGGTDLMIQKRSTAGLPPKIGQDVIYLFNLAELRYVSRGDGYLKIGAMTPLEDIYHHPDTPELLKKVIYEMASPGIRHMATMAGNIGNASPAGDSLVALYVLDARIKLQSISGERILPISDVIIGVRKTIIRPDELIAEILIPVDNFNVIVWRKVGGRRADAISKVSFAALIKRNAEVIKDIRIAFGAVSPTVVRSRQIEAELNGKSITELRNMLPSILEKYATAIRPIDDQRSSAHYRRQVASNMLRHLIEKEI
ncbi:MAG TPA: FAD binding domain-containing protein [Bacilli bacterium]|nr:FAD binding domain-containing protein [Bacilli bacterium]